MGFALLQMVAASAVGLILSRCSAALCLGQAATAEGLGQGSGQTNLCGAVVGLGLLGGAGRRRLSAARRAVSAEKEVTHVTAMLRRKLLRTRARRAERTRSGRANGDYSSMSASMRIRTSWVCQSWRSLTTIADVAFAVDQKRLRGTFSVP